MFPEAVRRYHDLLSDTNLAEAFRALLDEGLDQAKLIFGGRRLSPYLRPHFVSENDFSRIGEAVIIEIPIAVADPVTFAVRVIRIEPQERFQSIGNAVIE